MPDENESNPLSAELPPSISAVARPRKLRRQHLCRSRQGKKPRLDQRQSSNENSE